MTNTERAQLIEKFVRERRAQGLPDLEPVRRQRRAHVFRRKPSAPPKVLPAIPPPAPAVEAAPEPAGNSAPVVLPESASPPLKQNSTELPLLPRILTWCRASTLAKWRVRDVAKALITTDPYELFYTRVGACIRREAERQESSFALIGYGWFRLAAAEDRETKAAPPPVKQERRLPVVSLQLVEAVESRIGPTPRDSTLQTVEATVLHRDIWCGRYEQCLDEAAGWQSFSCRGCSLFGSGKRPAVEDVQHEVAF